MEVFAKVSDKNNPFHRPLILLKNTEGKVSFSFDGKTSICEHQHNAKTALTYLQQRKLASDTICNKCNSNENLLIGKLFEINMETSQEVAKSSHSFRVFDTKTDDYTYTKELFIFFSKPMDKEKNPYYKPDGPKEWYNTHIRAVQTEMKESNEEFLNENGDNFLYGHYIVSIRENSTKNTPIIGAIGIRIYYSKKARVYVSGTSSLNSVELSQERMILYNQVISVSFDSNYTAPSIDIPNLPIMTTCLSHLFAKCWLDYEIDVLNLDRFEDITNIDTLFFLQALQITFDIYENPFFPVYLNVIYQQQKQQQRGRRSTKKKSDALKRILIFDSKNKKNAKIKEEFNTILSKGGNPKFEIYQEVRSSKISYNKEDAKTQEQYALDAENMKLKFISFKVGKIIEAAYEVRPALLYEPSQLTFKNLSSVFYTYILVRLKEFENKEQGEDFVIDESLFKDQFSDLFSDRSGYDRAYLQENAYMFFMLQNTHDDEYKVIGKISGICDEYQNSFDHNYFRVLAKGTGYCRIMSYFCFLDLMIMYPEMQKLKIDNIVGPIGMRCYIPAAFDCGFVVKYINPLTNEMKTLDKDDNYNTLTRDLVDSPEYTFEIPGREEESEKRKKTMNQKLISFDLPDETVAIILERSDFKTLLNTMKTYSRSREQVLKFIFIVDTQDKLYKLLLECQEPDPTLLNLWQKRDSDCLDLFDSIFDRIVYLAESKPFNGDISKHKLRFLESFEYEFHFTKKSDKREYKEIYIQDAIFKHFPKLFSEKEQYKTPEKINLTSKYWSVFLTMYNPILKLYSFSDRDMFSREEFEKCSVATFVKRIYDSDKDMITRIFEQKENLRVLVKVFQLLYVDHELYQNGEDPFSEKHRIYTENTFNLCLPNTLVTKQKNGILRFFQNMIKFKERHLDYPDVIPTDERLPNGEREWIFPRISLKQLQFIHDQTEAVLNGKKINIENRLINSKRSDKEEKEDKTLFDSNKIPSSNYGIKKKFIKSRNEEEVCTWVKLKTSNGSFKYFIRKADVEEKFFKNDINYYSDFWAVYDVTCIMEMNKNLIFRSFQPGCGGQAIVSRKELVKNIVQYNK